MARPSQHKLARSALDHRLQQWREAPTPPVRGWLRAIREALGMSTTDVALRLGTSRQGVSYIERAEADGSISLETLRKAAAALDCRLVYALVPNAPLEEIVDRQARHVAEAELGHVRQTMLLEDQIVDDPKVDEHLLNHLAEEIKDSRRLWR